MKKNVCFFLLLCCLMISGYACAEKAYINGITADRVHLRNAPSQGSESLGLFFAGTEVTVDDDGSHSAWSHVSIGAMNGYIKSEYLQERHSALEMPAAVVKGGTLHLRAQPGKQSQSLRILADKEPLTVMGHTSNGWYYVKTSDGSDGYVMQKYVLLTGEVIRSDSEIMKVGETFDRYTIYSWIAPNGQTLYFSGLEDPSVKMEDVNFDGRDDVVFTIIKGASNFFCEFYVWNNGRYVHARHDGQEYGICNYHLYPEYGLVHSDANNGYAGALHEDVLFRWDGTDLKMVRRALSENKADTIDYPDGNGYSIAYDLQKLHVRVWDYPEHIYEGKLIYENVIDLEQITDDNGYSRAFTSEQEALWRDIK